MKTRKHDGHDLRRVLAAMVTDAQVLGRIAGQWEPAGLFAEPHANLIAGWCVRHMRKYGKPPGRAIEGIFQDWAEGRANEDDSTTRMVERSMDYISREHEREGGLASDYVLDVAAGMFDRVRLRAAIERAEADLDGGRVDDAYGRFAEAGRVELGAGALIKPAEDFDAWRKAFSPERAEPLFTYPGRLSWFLAPAMTRESLVAFMAPDKVGKSMVLLDLVYRAVKAKRRVALFDMGDMSENEILLRLGERSTRRPRKAIEYRWPAGIDDEGKVRHESRREKTGLSPQEAYRAFRRVCGDRDLLRLVCYPNSTMDVDGLASVLRGWERDKWVADVAVIDYADIMAPPKGIRDPLDQIDGTWRHLRRLSQEMHCLVVTATQSNAAAYREGKGMLTRRHFSGRKTKLAHVNGMIGINQSGEDKDRGIIRLNWVVRRQGRYNDRQSIAVAGCLDVSCPIVRS